jgi:hypothetical protein
MYLWIGVIKVILAVVGLGYGLARRELRPFTLFCFVLGVMAFLLSLGPNLAFRGVSPYEWLMEWYPGFAQTRNVFRFAIFVQIVVVLLAAVGLNGLAQLIEGRRTKRDLNRLEDADTEVEFKPRRGVASLWFVLVLGLLATIEIWPQAGNVVVVPDGSQQQGWLDWIHRNTSTKTVIAHVPFPKSRSVRDYQQTTEWMMLGLLHQRRMVNGYSGYIPKPIRKLQIAMRGFPDRASLDLLRQHGVMFCVVDRNSITRREVEEASNSMGDLEWVYGDDVAAVDIYRLREKRQ